MGERETETALDSRLGEAELGWGTGQSPVGGVAVSQVSPAKAVQPHHGGHGQVAWHQGDQQAAVLRLSGS